MAEVAVTEVFAGIAVSDHALALPWYERLFGRPPDLIPNDNESAWQVAGAGWLYIVGDPARSGSSLVTLLVDDLEERVAELSGRGIEAGPIDVLPGVVQKTLISDPDGNTIQLGQPLGGAAG
jgi:predicted enzyme related to lactoylglutathione lyase